MERALRGTRRWAVPRLASAGTDAHGLGGSDRRRRSPLTPDSDTPVGRSSSVPPEADAVRVLPCPFAVRAWWGDELVAESSAAVRVERPGRAPSLFLPSQDIRLEAFHREDQALDVEGGAAWSIGLSAHEGAGAAGHASWQSHGVPGLEG